MLMIHATSRPLLFHGGLNSDERQKARRWYSSGLVDMRARRPVHKSSRFAGSFHGFERNEQGISRTGKVLVVFALLEGAKYANVCCLRQTEYQNIPKMTKVTLSLVPFLFYLVVKACVSYSQCTEMSSLLVWCTCRGHR